MGRERDDISGLKNSTEPAPPEPASDAEIAAAAGIADEDSDLAFVRSYIDRASWRANLDDGILEEFLNMVYGGDE